MSTSPTLLTPDGEGNSLTLMDILADERSIYESIEAKFNCEQLYRLMNSCLDDREREILYLRYGLGGTRSYTSGRWRDGWGFPSYISRIEKRRWKSSKAVLTRVSGREGREKEKYRRLAEILQNSGAFPMKEQEREFCIWYKN